MKTLECVTSSSKLQLTQYKVEPYNHLRLSDYDRINQISRRLFEV